MKKVLLLCIALVLTACAQNKEVSKDVRFEKGVVLSEASKTCSMEIVVKSGHDVVLKKNEKCLDGFVISVANRQQGKITFDYSGVISDSSNPEKIIASITIFSRTVSSKVLSTSEGDVLEVPVMVTGNQMQRVMLTPGETYKKHYEGLDFFITMNK